MVHVVRVAPGESALLPMKEENECTTSKALVTTSDAPVPNSFLLLVVRPGAPSSILASSSKKMNFIS